MRGLLRRLRAMTQPDGAPFVPPGHFYSPIVDTVAVAAEKERLWPAQPVTAGVDWNDAGHRQILTEAFPRFLPLYDYPERLPDGPDLAHFYTRNEQFSWLDPRALFVLLHAWRPRRFIEVGSGYSTLLVADVNRRWFGSGMHVTCIEPYPRAFLKHRIDGISRLVEAKVQAVPLDLYRSLEAGDILFIDSSHVTKAGSDVNHLYFEVLPSLAPGVRIHVHDIFLPHEYPQPWVIAQNRSWNEQYLVRALLMYSNGFRVEFGSSYAFHAFPELVVRALAHPKGHGYGGGGLWFTKLV